MQTQIPQPVEEPEYHAAPEEDPAVSIATGEEPEEEEVEQADPVEGPDDAQSEVSELVRLAMNGFRHIQDLITRDDICLSCGAVGDHGTFNCRVYPANPDQIALGVGLLDSLFHGYRPPQRGSSQRSTDMEVDQVPEGDGRIHGPPEGIRVPGSHLPDDGRPVPTIQPVKQWRTVRPFLVIDDLLYLVSVQLLPLLKGKEPCPHLRWSRLPPRDPKPRQGRQLRGGTGLQLSLVSSS